MQKKSISKTLRVLLLGFVLGPSLLSGCGGAHNTFFGFTSGADYGDAPDGVASGYNSGITGHFPSRNSENGAHHLDLSDSAFGPLNADGSLSVSGEEDAIDPLDSDGVQNIDQPTGASDFDKRDDGLLSTMVVPNASNKLSFLVSVAASAPRQTRYVNILMDCDKDGKWSGSDSNGAEEHPVKNLAVNVTPGTTQAITTPEFLGCIEANPIWVRMTLTEKPIDLSAYPKGWDGRGEFETGETEDYLLRDHVALVIPDKNGGGGGGPFPPPPPPWPPVGGGGGGGGGGACEFWKTYGVTLCKGQSRTFLALVGGFAPDLVTASSSNPNIAAVEVNEANVTIKSGEEGEATITVTVIEDGCTYHVTVHVKVKKCEPAPKIDCCGAAQIAKDPSRCENCHVVGWKVHTNETPAGGGSSVDGGISETGSYGDTSGSVSKSTVVRIGNVIKIITTFYSCDPCPKEAIPGVDDDGDGIPNEEDWYPDTCYDPSEPHSFEEQLDVDRFFDSFFEVNTFLDLFDAKYFETYQEPYPEEFPGANIGEAYPGEVYTTTSPGTIALY